MKRTMWYQEVDADQKQIVDRVCIENCRILGLNSGKSGLFGLSTKQDAPIHAFEFRNSTFHANDMTKALITGVSSMKGNLDIVVENCTFVATKAGMTFFDLNAKNITNGSVTIKTTFSVVRLMLIMVLGSSFIKISLPVHSRTIISPMVLH